MSDRGSFDRDGTSDSPMLVPSDGSVGDGNSSPQQRDSDREASLDGSAQNADTKDKDDAATEDPPAASDPILPPTSASISHAPTANNSLGSTPINTPGSATATFVSANTTTTTSVPAALARPAGVLSNATVTGSVPAYVPTSAADIARTVPPGTNQALRHAGESFAPHPTDPTKIIARFRIEIPHQPGQFYEQVDNIPMRDDTAISPRDPAFYFVPDLTRSKIEKKIRKSKKNAGQPNLWIRQGVSNTWTRQDPKGGPDQVFELKVMFRRFNSTTHKYEEIYLNLRMLKNVDPNKKAWMYAYNKWIDQIRRRRDSTYTKIVHKDHWSVAERRALCNAINAYIRKAGLRRFGSGANVQISQPDMQVMADAVNNVGGMQRRPDAVRSQIFSSHVKKNKAIFDVVELAKTLRARLANGEVIPRAQRYPYEAIPPQAFPKDLTPRKKRPDGPSAGGKKVGPKKRNAAAMDHEADSDLSDVSADLRSPSRAADGPLPSFISDFLGSGNTSGVRPSKKVKFATDSGNELPSDDQWAETDEEILSENAEREREDADWESTDGSVISEENAVGEDTIDRMEEISEDDSSEDENSELEQQRERQHAMDLQKAIHRSIQPTPVSLGIAPPGEEDSSDSDSDSDAEPVPAPASSRKTAEGKRSDQAAAGSANPSPPKKRKRTLQDDEDDASEGDDEAEMGSPQGRAIKKARTKPGKYPC
jgi:hypothetical protein